MDAGDKGLFFPFYLQGISPIGVYVIFPSFRPTFVPRPAYNIYNNNIYNNIYNNNIYNNNNNIPKQETI